jgi:hypothetical protein
MNVLAAQQYTLRVAFTEMLRSRMHDEPLFGST